MKLQYKIGDLMKAVEPVIAHGCNAQGVMGNGVAKLIREYFPDAYDEYRKWYHRGYMNLGNVIWARTHKVIANCITQENYGTDKRYVDYDALTKCMECIDDFCYDHNLNSVAMPKIGAGLAGGDWNVIADIIENSFFHAQPVIYVLSKSEIPNQI